MTTYYCSSQGPCSFAFVVNFVKKCYLSTITLIFLIFYCHFFHYLPFYFLLPLPFQLSLLVFSYLSVFFSYPQSTLYILCIWRCICHCISVVKTLYDFFFYVYFLFLLLAFSKSICIVASLKYFRFYDFMNFDRG